MAEPIRVLHFADTHIGMENYGGIDQRTGLNTRVLDFLRRLDELIEHGRQHDVDLTIFAGDAFKTRSPSPTYQREFAYRIRELASLAPIVMLEGNHDLPLMMNKASSIEIYNTLAVPNVIVANQYELRVIDTKRGQVAIGFAPYPIRQRVIESLETAGMTIEQIDAEVQRELISLMETMANDAAALDMPRILTGHFTITGAKWGSERQIMLGRDVQMPLSVVANPAWDYVAMGHIHRYQNLTEGRSDAPPVVYSGSIERIDFGEEHDVKGFCWVEAQRGGASYQFVPLKARDFVTINADLTDSIDPTRELVEWIERYNLHGAVVRVIVQLTAETQAKLDDKMIRDALVRGGAHAIAALTKETEHVTRARLGANPEGLTDEELLDRYLLAREVPPERRESLAAAARRIFEKQIELDEA
jgi:exonuclease SbcD